MGEVAIPSPGTPVPWVLGARKTEADFALTSDKAKQGLLKAPMAGIRTCEGISVSFCSLDIQTGFQ